MHSHEPREEFVERLELQIGHEFRSRQRSAQVSLWSPGLRKKVALAASVLAVVSMGIGAAATAAAFQAKNNSTLNTIVYNLELRKELARQALSIAQSTEQEVRRNVAIGAADQAKLAEAQVKLADADTQWRVINSQLEEARATGVEPSDRIFAPLVGARDYVSERLRLSMTTLTASYELARIQYSDKQRGLSLGLSTPLDVAAAKVQLREAEVSISTLKRKLDIRRQFVERGVNATQAELLVLEGDISQRKTILEFQRDLAGQRFANRQKQLEIGQVGVLEVVRAKAQISELDADISKTEVDLEVVRQQLNPPKR